MIVLRKTATVMKIQEMRSGMAHLGRRAEAKKLEDFSDLGLGPVQPETNTVAKFPERSELDNPIWSVVSFDEIEAGGLTHRQASALIAELEKSGLTGLCIVTDEAASRLT